MWIQRNKTKLGLCITTATNMQLWWLVFSQVAGCLASPAPAVSPSSSSLLTADAASAYPSSVPTTTNASVDPYGAITWSQSQRTDDDVSHASLTNATAELEEVPGGSHDTTSGTTSGSNDTTSGSTSGSNGATSGSNGTVISSLPLQPIGDRGKESISINFNNFNSDADIAAKKSKVEKEVVFFIIAPMCAMILIVAFFWGVPYCAGKSASFRNNHLPEDSESAPIVPNDQLVINDDGRYPSASGSDSYGSVGTTVSSPAKSKDAPRPGGAGGGSDDPPRLRQSSDEENAKLIQHAEVYRSEDDTRTCSVEATSSDARSPEDHPPTYEEATRCTASGS